MPRVCRYGNLGESDGHVVAQAANNRRAIYSPAACSERGDSRCSHVNNWRLTSALITFLEWVKFRQINNYVFGVRCRQTVIRYIQVIASPRLSCLPFLFRGYAVFEHLCRYLLHKHCIKLGSALEAEPSSVRPHYIAFMQILKHSPDRPVPRKPLS